MEYYRYKVKRNYLLVLRLNLLSTKKLWTKFHHSKLFLQIPTIKLLGQKTEQLLTQSASI